jgi:hypothetical protein
VQRQDLLTESEIFEDQILSGTESTDNPSEEMSKRRNHDQTLIETCGCGVLSKSFIPLSARGFDEGEVIRQKVSGGSRRPGSSGRAEA